MSMTSGCTAGVVCDGFYQRRADNDERQRDRDDHFCEDKSWVSLHVHDSYPTFSF
jgi:hypothetical protein